MIIGAQTREKHGCALVYSSEDLQHGWTFAGQLRVPGFEAFGDMWECPSVEHIGGKDVLIFCPQHLTLPGRGGSRNHNGYIMGAMDWDRLVFQPDGQFHVLDFGFDSYAAACANNLQEAEKAILDSVQPQVDEIMARLENGESFLDLVDEYGTDTGMKDETNRENGYAVHAESMMYDTNFQRAAMELEKVGDVSKPVVTQFGVHILHYLKDIPGGPIEFTDELKETLKQEMTEENLTTAFNDKVNGWIEEAEIVYTEDGEAWRLPEEETEDAEAAPAEGETAPAEGETAPAEGETETTPDEGEAAPAEGETAETPAP